ncbi:hypothetical protein [uncultured Campylobacter sp.]|nr:hypothetical protein [uncultured Campylobacter sp.]
MKIVNKAKFEIASARGRPPIIAVSRRGFIVIARNRLKLGRK